MYAIGSAGAARQFGQVPHHGYDMTTWSPGAKRVHAAADRMHHAGALMPEHGGIGRSIVAVAAVQVGLAHAARDDLDEEFVGARIGQLDLIDDERAGSFAHDRGSDLHATLSVLVSRHASTITRDVRRSVLLRERLLPASPSLYSGG